MNALMYFGITIVVMYTFLLGYLFPRSENTYNLFKLRLDLYPYWMKYVSLGLFLVFTSLILVIDEFAVEWKAILITSINLCLFILLFSKEKYEDELSELLRYKSFLYSFLTFLVMAGICSIANILKIELLANLLFSQILIGVSLATSLVYFYYTKYRIQKENK